MELGRVMRPMGGVVLGLALLADAGAIATEAQRPAQECATAADYEEQGRASWYGRHRHGRRTANGERMDREALSAAHRRLPLGTRIKVTNLDNGRSVELTVNDRGPYARGRVLDVSQRAAEALGFVESGTARVRIEGLAGCPADNAHSG